MYVYVYEYIYGYIYIDRYVYIGGAGAHDGAGTVAARPIFTRGSAPAALIPCVSHGFGALHGGGGGCGRGTPVACTNSVTLRTGDLREKKAREPETYGIRSVLIPCVSHGFGALHAPTALVSGNHGFRRCGIEGSGTKDIRQ